MAQEKTPNGIPYDYDGGSDIYYLTINKGEFNKERIAEAKKWLKDEKDAFMVMVELNIYNKVKGKSE